jgi:ubiquinone/menaquinone biosynthesis C-methylase UbiE
MFMEKRKAWMEKDGKSFLKRIGIREGHIVLDFGARVGYYSIPAAQLVGSKGIVIAFDKDTGALDELLETAKSEGLENIKRLDTSGELKIPLSNESVDVVLLYDVLHLIDKREIVYQEVYRVLRPHGLLSVYPKHNKLDSPGWGLKDMAPEDIIREIECHGFSFTEKYCAEISHDDSFNEGCVLNFRQKYSK